MILCLWCGKQNEDTASFCEECGHQLPKNGENEKKLRERKDYWDYSKRYSLFGILIAIFILLLMLPVTNWFIGLLFPVQGAKFLSDLMLKYGSIAVILLAFFASVLPMIVRRIKIGCRYRWTRMQKKELEDEIEAMPRKLFVQGTGERPKSQKLKGSSAVPLVIIIVCAGLVFMNEFTNIKPLDSFKSYFGIGEVQTINGRYNCRLSKADMGGGVMRVDQTWSFVFYEGTYTSYLNGYQQFSGTWSQAGNALIIDIPAIKDMNPSYSIQATVSSDGNSFTAGENTFVKSAGG